MNRLRCGIVACLLMLVAGGRSLGAVRVAILQSDPKWLGNVVALVEAQLSADGKVAVVERQQIDKLLHEQQLQAALGADAVEGRVSLGKLLQADLLVFIDAQQQPQPHLSVTISETHQGLRLIRAAVPLADPEQAATEVEKLVNAAVEKQSHRIREIFAVPPFVSNDLGFDYAYLKGAYAKVVEGSLLRQPGVLVVELAEARALAKEIALTNGADVTRPLPLYVLGEYRTDGPKGERKVKLALKLVRGDKEVAGGTKEDLPLDQAPAFLRQVAAWFSKKSEAGPLVAADPKIEAAQLAERAHLLLSLGSWQESMDLAEASLLLNPSQPAVHRDVLAALAQSEDRVWEHSTLPPGTRQIGEGRGPRIRRGLEHLEPFLRETSIDFERDKELMAGTIGALTTMRYDSERRRDEFGPSGPGAAEYQEFTELRQFAQEIFQRVLDDKSRRKVPDDTIMFLHDLEALGGITGDEMRALNLKVLSQFTYLPDEGRVLWLIVATVDHPGNEDEAKYVEFLRQARELPNDSLRKRIDDGLKMREAARRQSQEWARHPVEPPTPQRAKPKPDDDVKLTRLDFKSDASVDAATLCPIEDWMPAGRGVDVVWNENGVYVMKQPGVFHLLDDRVPQSVVGYRPAVSFDGKYIWYTRTFGRLDRFVLLAIDPRTGTAWSIGEVDGLPRSSSLQVAGISPGRAIVVGNFGQTYAALVELTPESAPQGAKVRILHEFRRVPTVGDKEQWRDGDLIFDPAGVSVFNEPAADGSARPTAQVARRSQEPSLQQHPILIDLTSGGVRVPEQGQGLIVGDVRFRIDSVNSKMVLRQLAASGTTDRPVGFELRLKQLLEYNGALHGVGYDGTWAIASLDKGPFRRLKITPPPSQQGLEVRHSEHFGLVGWVNQPKTPNHAADMNVYRIEFAKPLRELLPDAPR